MQKCRVLMLLENNPFPQDPRVYQEAISLVNEGYQVSIICPKSMEVSQIFYEQVEGVHVYRFPIFAEGKGILGYLYEFGYALIAMLLLSIYVFFRRGFDVIHAHNPPDILVFVALPYKLLGKKFVFDHHDLAVEMYAALFGESEQKKPLKQMLLITEKLSYKFANHVIVTNESYKSITTARHGYPSERVTIVRNGPRLDIHSSDAVPQGKSPDDKKLIGYLGEIGYHDGVEYLLQAVHHLAYELDRKDTLCVVMGGGAAFEDMKKLSAELKLDDYVLFKGWVPRSEVHKELKKLDICVAPEPSNNYNDHSTMIKIMEYMAASKPVVGFDLKEHRFTAQDAGTYAMPNDPTLLATEILALMDNPQRREEMGKKGRDRVENELAWNYQAQRLLEVYKTLCP